MRTQTKKLLAIVCSGLMSVCCIFAGWLGLQKNTSVTAETVTGGTLSSYYAAESTSFNVEDDETFGATLGVGAYIQDGASFRKASPMLTSAWTVQKWEYNKLMKFGYATWKDATANNSGIRNIEFGGTSPAASWKPNNYNSYLVRLDYETDTVELYNGWDPTLADGTKPGRVKGASLSLALEYGKEYFIEVGAIDLYATEDKSGEIVGDRLIARIYDGETLLLEIKHDYTGTQVPAARAVLHCTKRL
ncbi:MAG: hypothetical protein J6A63_04405 [Clostridia bacterium]|nr:hypothetical protein [Clostridia bacterium]